MEGKNKITVGVFDDEDVLLKAIPVIKEEKIAIEDVFSPYPVHGIDDVLEIKRSRLPIAAFLFGMTGTFLALLMQTYMMAVDWPMIIGGKDYASVTFVPVTFELTVLLSAFGMVGTFLVVSNLKPWGKTKSPDTRSTDDKHIMVIDQSRHDHAATKKILESNGASEVYEKDLDDE